MPRYIHTVFVFTLLLGGCALLDNPVPVDWEHGAKRGTITQVFDLNTPAERLPACLHKLSSAQIAAHRYVEIEYKHRRHMFREAGELLPDMDVKAGDEVEFYPKNCDAGSLSPISRVLRPRP